jgi:hypothetical protein
MYAFLKPASSNKALFYDKPDINEELLLEMVRAHIDFPLQAIDSELQLPEFQLPYYEGFNK